MSCKDCKYSPKTYEEYCIGQSNPNMYCRDAYAEKSYLCDESEVKFDKETQRWLEKNLAQQTTVMKCEKCGLLFKPSLGHNCGK